MIDFGRELISIKLKSDGQYNDPSGIINLQLHHKLYSHSMNFATNGKFKYAIFLAMIGMNTAK